MIGKHHLKLDMPGEFSNKVLQKCLTTTHPPVRGSLYTGQPCEARSGLWQDSHLRPGTAAVFPLHLISCESPSS